MKIQWLDDADENAYWDLMKEPKKPKAYKTFDLHALCKINNRCTCGKDIAENEKRIMEARRRKYMVECE